MSGAGVIDLGANSFLGERQPHSPGAAGARVPRGAGSPARRERHRHGAAPFQSKRRRRVGRRAVEGDDALPPVAGKALGVEGVEEGGKQPRVSPGGDDDGELGRGV
jgi:hypothetical protein